VVIGAGGVLAYMIADRQLRLAPLTAEDADDVVVVDAKVRVATSPPMPDAVARQLRN
jgi:hypothetical protein